MRSNTVCFHALYYIPDSFSGNFFLNLLSIVSLRSNVPRGMPVAVIQII